MTARCDRIDLSGYGVGATLVVRDGVPERVEVAGAGTPTPGRLRRIVEQASGFWVSANAFATWRRLSRSARASEFYLETIQPTHRLEFVRDGGIATSTWLVRLAPDGSGMAPTHDELTDDDPAAWSLEDGQWSYYGAFTPHNFAGVLVVTDLIRGRGHAAR